MSVTVPAQPMSRKRLATRSSLMMLRTTPSRGFATGADCTPSRAATVIYLTVRVSGLTEGVWAQLGFFSGLRRFTR